MLNGVENLNKIIKDFFTELGYEEITPFLSTDFGYYYGDEKISYTIFEMPTADKGFQMYIEKHFHNVPKCSIFTLSLLHELGHHETIDDISEKIYIKCCEKKFKLANKEVKTEQDAIKRQVEYCGIYDEKIATAKAIEILADHYSEVIKFEKTILEALSIFYEKNNIKNA